MATIVASGMQSLVQGCAEAAPVCLCPGRAGTRDDQGLARHYFAKRRADLSERALLARVRHSTRALHGRRAALASQGQLDLRHQVGGRLAHGLPVVALSPAALDRRQ
eukprot:6205500-Pleurochrysis_carterae.AAC.1